MTLRWLALVLYLQVSGSNLGLGSGYCISNKHKLKYFNFILSTVLSSLAAFTYLYILLITADGNLCQDKLCGLGNKIIHVNRKSDE